MTKALSNTLMLILACVGSILALLLTIEYITPDKFTLPCSVQGTGCSGTLHSDYSHLGPIPTSGFGLAMYALIVALCLRRRKLLREDWEAEAERARAYAASEDDPASDLSATTTTAMSAAVTPLRTQIKRLDLIAFLLAVSGFCISWWLQYVSIWVVGSFCPYCFTSALIVTALCGFASRDYLLDGRALTGEQKMLGVVVGFVLVMLGFIFVPQALQIIQVGKPPTGKPEVPKDQATVREVAIRPDMHILGDPKSKYLVVEFADYLCPHCAEASKLIPGLLKKRPDVHFAFRNYPLAYPQVKFPHSDTASNAAEAAALQGKFWEVHDYLFAHQDQIKAPTFSVSQFTDIAREFHLNVDQFTKDMLSDAVIKRVHDDHADGDRADIKLTPTFFVITPDKITSFSGGEELTKAMNNPQDKMWK